MQKNQHALDAESSDSEAVENSNDDQEMDSEIEKNQHEAVTTAGPSGSKTADGVAKKKKRGIIYISSIPKYMNVTILREMLSQYAKIGRIFLQPGKLSGQLIK